MSECYFKTKGASPEGPRIGTRRESAGPDRWSQHLKGMAWAALEVENHCVGPEGFAHEGTPA